jgi:XRE family transcriptional regulator, regulator of sulfur utilization
MGAPRNAKALRRLGDRVRQLRRERELSQESLAFDAGIHTNHLSSIERGEANPSFLLLVSIAKRLGVKVADLVAE